MNVVYTEYQSLTTDQLYEILRLRAAVFVVEQDCVYQDLDNKDQKAVHVLGYKGADLVAYTRVFGPGDYFDQASIGRVVVSRGHRGLGYGYQIMQSSIDYCYKLGYRSIKISAQCYLDRFYKQLGFKTIGDTYLEDGIDHQQMILHQVYDRL